MSAVEEPTTSEDHQEVAGEKLKGRVALVTGGSRGIGAAIVHSLASQGADIAAGYSSNSDAAEELKSALESNGTKASVHQGNVGNPDDCKRVIEEVLDEHGRLDILVNNAGITSDGTILKLDDEDWEKVLRVNLGGAFTMSREALSHMIDRGSGRIVYISSVIGQMGNVGQANYAASKSGMFGLTKTLAREAAQQVAAKDDIDPEVGGVGLTVNAVAPGFIETDMIESIPDKVVESLKKQIPSGRLGQPEEIARVVHFLCADASSYITGQVWAVNGGMEMHGA